MINNIKKILTILAIFLVLTTSYSADLKQLAEQLVNKVDVKNLTNDTLGYENLTVITFNESDLKVERKEIKVQNRSSVDNNLITTPPIIKNNKENYNDRIWCPELGEFFDSYTFILDANKTYVDTFSFILNDNVKFKDYDFKINQIEINGFDSEKPEIIIEKYKIILPEFLENTTNLNAKIIINMPKNISLNSYVFYEIIPILDDKICDSCQRLYVKLFYSNSEDENNKIESFRARHGSFSLRAKRHEMGQIVGFDDGSGWKKGSPENYDEIDAFRTKVLDSDFNEVEKIKEVKIRGKIENVEKLEEKNEVKKEKTNKTLLPIVENKIFENKTIMKKDTENENKTKEIIKVKLEEKFQKLENESNGKIKLKKVNVNKIENKTVVNLVVEEKEKIFGIFDVNVNREYNCGGGIDDDCQIVSTKTDANFILSWFVDKNKKIDFSIIKDIFSS